MTGTHKILLVDDDSTLLLTTKTLLAAQGYTVVTHEGGFGVAEVVWRHKPDLILLDVNMPGLSGEGIAKMLSENPRLSEFPILFHSSNDAENLHQMAKSAGVAGYVCKGDVFELKRKVAKALAG